MDSRQIANEITMAVQRVQPQQAMAQGYFAPQGFPGAVSSQQTFSSALGVGKEFCQVWATARPILEFLAGIIGFIPGISATAGAVRTALIKVGDQVSAELCK